MRLEITRKSDLALRALRELGEGRTRRADLAEAVGTSPEFLAQVMNPLVKAGWVDSKPGAGGGYQRGADPCEISVLALIELLEGPVVDGRCVLEGGECPPEGSCSMHTAWSRARDALIGELEATSIVEC